MQRTNSTEAPRSSQKPGKRKGLRSWPGVAVGLVALGAVGGMLIAQWNASDLDFAAVNVISAICLLVLWGCLVAALRLSSLPRGVSWAVTVLPVICLALFLCFYRVERLDGELVPKFRHRWAEPPALTIQAATAVNAESQLFEPRTTDFPHFLGPTRNGVVVAPAILTDWEQAAPQVLWTIPVGPGWSGFAVQGDIAITMEQRDVQEWVTAYNANSGELVWSYAMEGRHFNMMGGAGPRSTPSIANGLVYAASAVSQLVCLDLRTGQEKWQQSLLELAGTTQEAFEKEVSWGRSASPLVWNGLVIASLGGAKAAGPVQTLIACDAVTGEERWRVGDDQISYSSPTLLTIGGEEQIAIISERALLAFSPTDQQKLWSVDWPGSSAGAATVSQPIQVGDNQVFMSKGYGEGCQLIEVQFENDQWTPTVLWQNKTALRTKFTSAVVHAGHAYGLSDGILECVDLRDGQRKWKKGRYQQGQVLLVGAQLVITSERGEIVLVDASPDAFVERAKFDVIGDVTWNTAALSGDRLFMRNSDEAACVRLPMAVGGISKVDDNSGEKVLNIQEVNRLALDNELVSTVDSESRHAR